MEQIEKNIKIQKTIFLMFVISLVVTGGLVEFFLLDAIGPLFAENAQAEFICQSIMILLSLVIVYGSLRLFKFESVRTMILKNPEQDYFSLSSLRISLVSAVATLNILLYWGFCNASFFWLAAICALAYPFVYPTKERYYNETGTMEL